MPPLRHPINCSSVSESCAQERGANHTKREIGRTGGWYLLRADLISSRSVIHAGRTLAIAQAYLPNHFPRFIYILKLSRLARTNKTSEFSGTKISKPKPQTAFLWCWKLHLHRKENTKEGSSFLPLKKAWQNGSGDWTYVLWFISS